MKRYDSYKDSGIEVLGLVPSHWKTSKFKFTHIEFDIRVESEWTDFQLLSLTKQGVIIRDIDSGKGKFPESFDTYKKVEVDNLIFCLYDIEETPRTVGLSNHNGMITGSYKIFKSLDVIPKFTYYTFLSIDDVKGLKPYYTGLRNVVRPETFKSLPFHSPPLSEQQQIVSYLDTKTSQIDSLIEKTQRKIELLKEKRTSLINEVVTKGLNPNVEMKESGVEWIGEIPSHWVNSKLGFYTSKIGSGSTPRGGSEVYVDEGIPFIRSQNVHFIGLILEGISFIEVETHLSMLGSKVEEGDVLLNITGGSIGRCCVVQIKEEMNINQHVSIIRAKPSLNNYFLNYILQSDVGQLQVRYNISGGNREGLTIEGIRDFQITLPPTSEQNEIVSYLDEHTQLIDQTISVEQRRIELLKEFRQSLISEVVTGKRKVF